MPPLRAQDKEEIEAYRDRIAQRLEELEDAVSFGLITDDDKHAMLMREFGPDYQATLVECNNVLHSAPKHLDPHSHVVLMVFVGFVIASAAVFAGLVIPTALGTVQGAATHYDTSFVISAGQTHRIPLSTDITIEAIEAQYLGAGTYTLLLEDANNVHVLMTGDQDTHNCEGCGQAYTPPYMLRLERTTGVLSVEHFAVHTQ